MTEKDQRVEELRGFVQSVGGVRVVNALPGTLWQKAAGRGVDRPKAIMLHFGVAYWFSKADCVLHRGDYYAKNWAIESAKARVKARVG